MYRRVFAIAITLVSLHLFFGAFSDFAISNISSANTHVSTATGCMFVYPAVYSVVFFEKMSHNLEFSIYLEFIVILNKRTLSRYLSCVPYCKVK